ncbi:GSCOCG00010919001-RA-CDS [Cotesia congregata]|nr:GSCOCG00010919001-RA-CDS [Cotesia congregata]
MSESRRGKGAVNHIINKLPFELHIPGYQYCGPGTKLAKRLARGDPRINPLDSACKEHDIAYSKNRENLEARHEADKILAEKAWQRFQARDATISEKATAWNVNKIMKLKRRFGMDLKKEKPITKLRRKTTKRKTTKRKTTKRKMIKRKTVKRKTTKLKTFKKNDVALRQVVDEAKKSMQPGEDPVKTALEGARKAVKKAGGKKNVRLPRILPVPSKIGGVLPFLIPLFAGLSAVGTLTGGAAGVAKAVNDASVAKNQLVEKKRHNLKMEEIAVGRGLYLKPYRSGM